MIEPVGNLPYDSAMKLFLRQSCVFFLLLLQGIAPFVHAHTHEHEHDLVVNTGFHSHLESHEIISEQPICKAVNTIIALSPLIKEKQEKHDSFMAVSIQLYMLEWLQASSQKEILSFATLISPSNPRFTYHNTGPRAPPSALLS